MQRHWDIKLVVIALLGAAAFSLVILLQNFGMNSVPDENVVYVDTAVGGIEDDPVPDQDNDEFNPDEDIENGNQDRLEPVDELDS